MANDFDADKHPRDKNGKFAALGGSQGHEGLIASARVSAKGVDRLQYTAPTIERMAMNPETLKETVAIFNDKDNYPGLRPDVFTGTDREQMEHIRDVIASNLEAVYREASEKIRQEGMIWYQSAHDIAQQLSEKYNIPLASVVGAVAKLSPGKDWNMNVEMGKQMARIWGEQQDHKWDAAMEKTAQTMRAAMDPVFKKADDAETRQQKELASQQKQAAFDLQLSQLRDKTLAEVGKGKDSDLLQALWMRQYAQAHNIDPETLPGKPGWRKEYPDGFQTFPKFLPNGTEGPRLRSQGGTGPLQPLVWQSRSLMANAVSMLKSGGNPSIISENLGNGHKVRSFYNNMLDPKSGNGDSTIDTHEVGASWIRSVGQKDTIVAQNFGTGVQSGKKDEPADEETRGYSAITGLKGTYAVYRDAHTQLADKLGILPQQLQAIVWVTKKDLFDGLRDSAKGKIDQVWKEYNAGKGTLAEAQQAALQVAKDDKVARKQEAAEAEQAKLDRAASRAADKAAKEQARADKVARKK